MSEIHYALSIKQPWAALLISGRKSIEVRKWPTSRRGSVLIHAARIPDNRPEAWAWISPDIQPLTRLLGGIIGSAELTDCVTYPDLETFEKGKDLHLNEVSWFEPPRLYGFVFEKVMQIPFRPYSGNIRFFRVKEAAAE